MTQKHSNKPSSSNLIDNFNYETAKFSHRTPRKRIQSRALFLHSNKKRGSEERRRTKGARRNDDDPLSRQDIRRGKTGRKGYGPDTFTMCVCVFFRYSACSDDGDSFGVFSTWESYDRSFTRNSCTRYVMVGKLLDQFFCVSCVISHQMLDDRFGAIPRVRTPFINSVLQNN